MTPRSVTLEIGLPIATAIVLAAPSAAQDFQRDIMSGPLTETTIQAATDIQEMAARCGLHVNVVQTDGELENFLGVRRRPFTQLGFSQSDVLEYMRTFAETDPVIARAAQDMRLVMPLYDAEVQLLASLEVESLDDLNGLRVGVGSEGSGTFMTSSLILGLADVEPAETVVMAPQGMLNAFLAGELDAIFTVSGAPTMLLQSPRLDPEKHHLVPLTDPMLESIYTPAVIPAGTYGFDSEPVSTVAVKTVLMTYEYDPEGSEYLRQSCKAVSDLTHLVSTRFGEMVRQGHPKWATIDLADLPEGWEVSQCVNEGLREDYVVTCAADEEMVPSEILREDANAIYRDRICSVMGGC